MVDLGNSRRDDLDTARELLREGPECIRIFRDDGHTMRLQSVEEALYRYFKEAGEILVPLMDLIEDLGSRLACHHPISAFHGGAGECDEKLISPANRPVRSSQKPSPAPAVTVGLMTGALQRHEFA